MVAPDAMAAVEALLDREFGLVALWLHGSEAKGTARPDSDVDLAVLVRQRPDVRTRVRVAAEASELLGRTVDLVILGDVGDVLPMQVLRHGKLLVDADPHLRALFVLRALTAYADLKRSRAPVEAALVARMGHG